MKPRYIVCPHCDLMVQRGFRVCAGCDAKVHYGAPRALMWLAAIPAIAIMIVSRRFFYDAPLIVALLGGVVLGGFWGIFGWAFEGRAVFMPRQTQRRW